MRYGDGEGKGFGFFVVRGWGVGACYRRLGGGDLVFFRFETALEDGEI